MLTALCIFLFFAGHVVRDGWPSFKDYTKGVLGTHAARISGALLCGLGALSASSDPVFALIVFASILAGFYFDMKHGEAAGVDTPTAVFDSFLSGLTSVTPLATAFWFLLGPYSALAALVGFIKPAIWKAGWLYCPTRQDTWFQPTRIAAGTFGAAIGALVALVK